MRVEGKTGRNRTSRRGDAWELGMVGEYSRALEIIDELLHQAPTDIITLRMKGNLLELRALDFAQYQARKLLRSRDYVNARKCYEEILRAEPDNTVALIDLGDHYRNLGASTKALEYYEQAIALLNKGRFSWSRKEEIEEAFEHAAELYAAMGREPDRLRVKRLRRQLLSRIRARQSRRRVKRHIVRRR